MTLTGNSSLRDILANPRGAALIEGHFPELLEGWRRMIFSGMSVYQIGYYAKDVLDASRKRALIEGLDEISQDLDDLALPRGEVIKALKRQKPSRVPIILGKWWGEGLNEQYGDQLQAFSGYPDDVVQLWLDPVPFHQMDLSWELPRGGAYDSQPILDDWAKLDELIEKLPDPETDPQLDWIAEAANAAHDADRYVLLGWWQLFFERPWAIRGMVNIMLDYSTDPDNVRRLHQALLDQYCGYLRRAARLCRPDGLFTSDDLGHQNGPMIGPKTFREFMAPYYATLAETLRESGMHFWLHSCGDNTLLMEELIDVGVDVLHPIQKHCMDESAIAREYGDRITFLAGIDVQHTLQEKDPEGVRREVRFLIDTFDRPAGGMCIASGNGITPDTPLENIEAFLGEALRYGQVHRDRYL
jgi:uroporphyrinogen decarboxylase